MSKASEREKSFEMEMDGMTRVEFWIQARCFLLLFGYRRVLMCTRFSRRIFDFVLHTLGLFGAQDDKAHLAHRRAEARGVLRMSRKEQPAPSFGYHLEGSSTPLVLKR